MNKIFYSLLILSIVEIQFGYSQLKFNELIHDFGLIKEGVQAQHLFQFKNIGKDTLSLKKVQASCGCTTPRWTTKTLKHNDTGSINVTYNSQGRPGIFEKTITVVYDTAKGVNPLFLTIKGNVDTSGRTTTGATSNHDGHNHDGHNHNQTVTHTETKMEVVVAFKDTIGNLVFDKLLEQVGELKTDTDREFIFLIKNIGKTPIQILDKTEGKACYSFSWKDKILKPAMESNLKIKFTGSKSVAAGLTSNGPVEDTLSFFTNEKTKPKKSLRLSGAYKRILTQAEIDAAPKIKFEMTEFDAGQVIQGQAVDYIFKFTNTGKSDLVIENARASCGCTASAPKDKVIKSGATSQIEAKFDSRGKSGAQHKTITVTSNDPNSPNIILNLKCNIVVDPFQGGGGAAPINKNNLNAPEGF